MQTARMIVDRDYIIDRTDEKLFCSVGVRLDGDAVVFGLLF